MYVFAEELNACFIYQYYVRTSVVKSCFITTSVIVWYLKISFDSLLLSRAFDFCVILVNGTHHFAQFVVMFNIFAKYFCRTRKLYRNVQIVMIYWQVVGRNILLIIYWVERHIEVLVYIASHNFAQDITYITIKHTASILKMYISI